MPRGSISYHQLRAIVVSPDCRTWCHQPAGKYSVSPASTEIVVGCAEDGKLPGISGAWIEDQRTEADAPEGLTVRHDESDMRV